MRLVRSLDEVDRDQVAGGALAIGNFDGVHIGHQRIIAAAGQLARPVVAMTFDPLPMEVLNPRQAPPVMTTAETKAALLAQAGADVTVIVPTDGALLGLEPETFVERIVVGLFAPAVVVEGPDFGFGRDRRGDIEMLERLGRQHGFRVQVVEQVRRALPGHHEPVAVSSTLVRRLIGGGSVEAAAACLGRPYRLIGRAVPGAGRGRAIGVPTVNLDVGRQLLPADGIYAARAFWPDHELPAAMSIGPAPTFGQSESAVEAHLLDFAGRFDADRLALDLLGRVRGIEKFDSAEALVAQIRKDIAQVRRIIG